MSEHCTPEDMAKMAATTDQHKMLEKFVGTWKSEVKMWMGPGDPMVSTGKMVNTMDLGGRYLRHEYTGDPNDGPFPNFEGRGFWGYNTMINKWEGLWIDNASTMMQKEVGDLDAGGRVWSMFKEFPNPAGGPPTKMKSVITHIDDDHHSMEMFTIMEDGKEMKNMEIQYARA